jgi:phenylpyruvate tautomerase PptA (4-oxalocrotonate tautomerase family)
MGRASLGFQFCMRRSAPVAAPHYPAVTLYVEINDRRTLGQKRDLARLLTEACVEVLDASPEDVSVRFRILSYDHMARGGALLSDRHRRPAHRS